MSLRLCFLLICLSFTFAAGSAIPEVSAKVDYAAVCKAILGKISKSSQVVSAGGKSNSQYLKDITAWSTTNVQQAACVVEPATSQDVSATLKILGSKKAKFAIKSGGHSPNPGFSSTVGVLISLNRFSTDDVYSALAPHKVSVLGARASGIGAGGFLLGGGYSFKTNQYGLAIDTIIKYSLVQPNGEIVTVTEKSRPDLFFGLKGGLNNFGIVTEFTMKAFPQTAVWGGILIYDQKALPAVRTAATAFLKNNKDRKASIITTVAFTQGQLLVVQVLFYDAPNPPRGLFDSFLKIQASKKDLSSRSLVSLIKSIPIGTTTGIRNSFSTVPIVEYTPAVIDVIINQTMIQGKALANKSAAVVSHSIESFTPGFLSHGLTGTAYPPDRVHAFSPFFINYAWVSQAFDNDFNTAMNEAQVAIRKVATSESVGKQAAQFASLYPNYAPSNTPLEQMYGKNLPMLKAIKKKVDPENVMGLAGGFRFT
ncbi:FAD-binding domain containing protein [Amanita muscaria]